MIPKKDTASHQPDENFFPSPNQTHLERIEEDKLDEGGLDKDDLGEDD
jgi:hypothetical protein